MNPTDEIFEELPMTIDGHILQIGKHENGDVFAGYAEHVDMDGSGNLHMHFMCSVRGNSLSHALEKLRELVLDMGVDLND